MDPTPGPRPDQHVGRHGLGPHVVGLRVVVRRLVRGETGPTGGPAFTDLLGTCTAWDGTTCVVRPEEGEPVTIAVADIVSGKPVPPRPPARHRVPPAEAQRRALALWPEVETERVGDWLLRHCPATPARHANSVLAMGPSGVADDVERVERWYAARTGRPVAAVLAGSAEEARLRDRGWLPGDGEADTVFALAGVARARRALGRPAAEGEVALVGDDRLVRAELVEGGRVVAAGVAAYEADWVGLRGIEVAGTHRRRGLAGLVVGELLGWGAEHGATTAHLQVRADDEPALRLCHRLGFAEHHRYRYLTVAG